jgi:polyisoprenoid-binding protein YceI
MPSTTKAGIRIFTFKQGMLSAVAHDLRLSLCGYELDLDGGKLRFSADPASIRVDGVMRTQQLDQTTLDAAARAEIERTLREQILHVQEHPRITFSGSLALEGPAAAVEGALVMCGVAKPLRLSATRGDAGFSGQVELRPSDWGIRPYRALLGAIKLQDRVIVEFRVPRLEDW